MNRGIIWNVLRWLIWDTFRQGVASSVCWLMLGVTILSVVFCLSISITGPRRLAKPNEPPEFYPRDLGKVNLKEEEKPYVDRIEGEMRLAFGAIRVDLGRDAHDAVRYLQLILAGAVADALGVLLALTWTAGFLPNFLDPSSVTVLLAKPVPRWALLTGKFTGVVAFVAVQAALFVFGTWAALGVKTGIWDPLYLFCLPLLALHFAIFYSFSTLLAVTTRSTIACFFGSVVFWFVCWGMNYGRHAILTLPELQGMSPVMQSMAEVGYWIMPKPADLGMVLFDALHAGNYFSTLIEFDNVREQGVFSPFLSTVSSVIFMFAMLWLACREFRDTDY